jgi:hypothetical protein
MAHVARLTADKLVITVDGSSVVIDRASESLVANPSTFSALEMVPFDFVLGVYEVSGKKYIAFATSVSSLTSFWDINYVSSWFVLPISLYPDSESRELLTKGLSLSTLYYSTSRDLSLSLRQTAPGSPTRDIFVWNSAPLRQLRSLTGERLNNVSRPVIAGFIGTFERPAYTFVLISRRSPVRAGVRFWVRGADTDGYVANYIETEQIVASKRDVGLVFSHVQVRGSIPLVWSQYPDLSRMPAVTLADESLGRKALSQHFERLSADYGEVVVVSLTDGTGREKELTDLFKRVAPLADGIAQFEWWDFHTECAHMQWGNIDKLIALIQEAIDRAGYTQVVRGSLQREQGGVVRTNCIDCLDRTNVVQSVIARIMLERQLKEIGLQEFDCLPQFRGIWADNADVISVQYAGTRALKTDFTRTGKRTIMGSLADGANALKRYYLNTVVDGTRQDAYDAVTQSVSCQKFTRGNGLLFILIMTVFILVLFSITALIQGKKVAWEKAWRRRIEAVNRPSFRDPEIRNIQAVYFS